jgi:PleD family two-component response regulator
VAALSKNRGPEDFDAEEPVSYLGQRSPVSVRRTIPITEAAPPISGTRRRILIADRDKGDNIKPVLRRLDADIIEAESGEEIEQLLETQGPFDLVVTNAQLQQLSGLQVLARARIHGVRTPFIVITSVHGLLLRVFISDTSGTVLSSRVVDPDNLAVLAGNLIKDAGTPA